MKLWLAAALIPLCLALMGLFLAETRRERFRRAFWYKGFAGLCFLLTGALFLPGRAAPAWGVCVCAGLCCGLGGDQLLALRRIWPERHDRMFLLGALVFAVGHLFYLAALALRFGLRRTVLALFAALALPSVLYGRRRNISAGRFQIPGTAYLALVALMAAAAMDAAIRARLAPAPSLFALGGLCFLVSDNLLFSHSFGDARHPRVSLALHVFYYCAQLLIAWSMYF